MTSLFVTLFISMFLPLLAKLPLVAAMHKMPGGYDNHHPRAQQRALTGFGERAQAAHYNSFEALMFYAAAVLTVVALGEADTNTLVLAWLFVVARIGYLVCYWVNQATLRSLLWLAGVLATFVMAGRAIWG